MFIFKFQSKKHRIRFRLFTASLFFSTWERKGEREAREGPGEEASKVTQLKNIFFLVPTPYPVKYPVLRWRTVKIENFEQLMLVSLCDTVENLLIGVGQE